MYVKKITFTLITFSSIGFCWWLPVQQSSAEVERARIENDLAFRVKQSGINQPNQVESGAASDQSGTGNADTGQQRQQGTPSQDRPVNKGSGNKQPVATRTSKQSHSSNTNFDIDRFARAVASHETVGCTMGYGRPPYNNCFGIKNGSIAPCKKMGKNRMCMYETREESFEAFKAIWKQGYGNRLPTLAMAHTYSGSDRSDSWLVNVLNYYNNPKKLKI